MTNELESARIMLADRLTIFEKIHSTYLGKLDKLLIKKAVLYPEFD